MKSQMPIPHKHIEDKDIFIKEQIEKENLFLEVAGIFKILNDSSRLKIFWILCHREICVMDIAAMTGMSSPAISHHLRMLKDMGIIEGRREGKEVYYKAKDILVCRALHQAIEKIMDISCKE
ncbi:ArsR/SmtB family transcription factor [Peptoniphilaceae bacterium SGI.131]